ncbi:MAG: cell division protein ZapA [Bergeyella zoohelcum]|nr:cell division protein ZapA [Bergeyella zoohelcum]
MTDEIRNISIHIAGRKYPLNDVKASQEEMLRRVARQIEEMIKEYEKHLVVRDKQDSLAMIAFRMGVDAELAKLKNKREIGACTEKVKQLNQIFDGIED